MFVPNFPATNAQREESLEGFISGVRANAVKGDVTYQRDQGKFPLEAGLRLQEGDFIRSGFDDYAEVLLQPGNYLRVGGDTECRIFSDPHDKMRLKLDRGSINVEILSNDWDGYTWFPIEHTYELIRVITPNAEVYITEPGIFRINTSPGGNTEVIAREGSVVINGRRVKEKRRAIAYGPNVTITEANMKLQDDFDAWSRARADVSVKANRLLKDEAPWSRNRKEGQETTVELPEEAEKQSSPYIVSAKPGAINFVEAGVEVSQEQKEWEPLTEKVELESGDKLRTHEYSFVELMMLPDMYLRINAQSEISLERLSNESISLKVLRGSAILEVARFERKLVPEIAFGGQSTSVFIADEGNYRVDVKPHGEEILIREGKVVYKGRSVSSCRKVAGGQVYDCERKRTDNFDFWSHYRGEGVYFNGRMSVDMATHLSRARRGRFKNTGFWYQNPGQTSYTFVPFTSTRFRSPYGGYYSTVLSPRRIQMNRIDHMGGRPTFRYPGSGVMRPRP